MEHIYHTHIHTHTHTHTRTHTNTKTHKHTHTHTHTHTHLYARLRQVGHHGEALAHDHVRVVRLGEGLLQRRQLLIREGSPAPSLLSMGAVTGLKK